MTQHALACALSLFASLTLTSWSDTPENEKGKRFRADLDTDGTPERVEVRYSGKTELGKFYHLVVLDSQGEALWSGPRVLKADDPLVFGEWDYGVSMPQVVGDVDNDGKVELVAPGPQSDVSPTTFRVLRWKDKRFEPVRAQSLLEASRDSGKYRWGYSETGTGRWIAAFRQIQGGGVIEVSVTEYKGGSAVKEGVALVSPDERGYTLKSWVKPLAAEGPEEASESEAQSPSASAPAAASASGKQGALASYTCQIGEEDMKSSKGARLTSMAAILAQDRANFHRFKIRHRRDLDEESYFASAENRQLFERLPIDISSKAKEWIAQGNAVLQVSVYPDRIEVRAGGE